MNKLSTTDKIKYSGAALVGGGALVGGASAERPIFGILIGGALGFVLWSAGVSLYTGYLIKSTTDKMINIV